MNEQANVKYDTLLGFSFNGTQFSDEKLGAAALTEEVPAGGRIVSPRPPARCGKLEGVGIGPTLFMRSGSD